ncbi:MAG: glycosyltransferase family 39 protein [Anaerolineales bacterium]|uniref:glycosyltransferase family 39 protein n=1 Tax=Candidatus Villigracilis proximus TaxID=3140683 RepID=UPI0031351C84|nr:glycosyltransferase family 39 protein [Anaerolineales bacterium]
MRRILNVLIVLLAALLIVQAGYSTQWPIAHDEAPLFYEAFMMRAEDLVPYRDLFDFQMPGSFIAYTALGLLSGFDSFRIRILDLVILTALLIITFFATQRFGKTPALAAAILFGLKYLQGGPSMSLQREYLLLFFIALALWISMQETLTLKHRITLGLFFGLAAVIKPHAAIGLIPILLFDIADLTQRLKLTLQKAAATSILPAATGFAIPVLVVIVWLALTNALIPFINIAMNYWPLYSQVNGEMAITTSSRLPFLLTQTLHLGGHALWLIPALLGVYLNQNKKTYLLVSLALCYAIYPAFSGQFFPYHYIPFIYFIILLSSLAITQSPFSTSHLPPSTILLSSFFFLLTIFALIRPSTTFIRQLNNQPIITSTDRAREISRFLEKNLQDGDTVQPLDWTGGTLLAMLESRARLATPYVFDFYFYHHVSNPYIQSLRADFMNDLQAANPRFIIEVTAIDKPWITGPDTSREFPELRAFLNENYSVTIHKDDYTIYEFDDRP